MDRSHDVRHLEAYLPRQLIDRPGPPRAEWWDGEGSLAFADISGFTRLSEKLARRGKIGAEELALALSDVFEALLDAPRDGGDLLKFGGDALLLFYQGNDHALRAAHAADEIRRALARVGGLDTAVGRVRLRMSIGIASGPVSFHVVGTDHLELLVLGPTASTTTAMESAADAGEILVSRTTADLLPARWMRGAKGDGVLLGRPGELAPLPLRTNLGRDSLETYLPRRLRPLIMAGRAEREHRLATIGFVHIGGVDALLASEGPAAVFDRLQQTAVIIEAVTTEHDVTIIGTDLAPDGAKYILATGVPESGEEDDARLLVTARKIIEQVDALPIRIGLNRGRVFAGDVGAPFRHVYTIMGDPVNLAARVMGRAGWGQVLAHADVVRHGNDRVRTTPVAPFLVKGKTQLVEAATVDELDTGRSSRDDRRVNRLGLPLVGRVDEMALLLSAADDALAGRGRTVELVGDAGIGKSRLVAELRAARPGLPVLTIEGDPYRTTVPYGGLRDLVRAAIGCARTSEPGAVGDALINFVRVRAPDLEPWLPLLAPMIGANVPRSDEADDLVGRFREERSQSAMAELLGTAFAGPHLVHVDNVQWLDDGAREVLSVAGRWTGTQPWLVVTTRREDGPPLSDRATRLLVGPLDEREATQLVHLAEPAPAAAGVLDDLLELGAGNPQFLIELVHEPAAVAGQGATSIEEVVTARLDRLPADDRRTLRNASVLGVDFAMDLLELMPGSPNVQDPSLWQRLDTFVATSGGAGRFRTRSYRDAAYEGMPYARRRVLHALAADALATRQDTPLAVLSSHWTAAEQWERAWITSLAAARDAAATAAPDDAATLYQRALLAARKLGTIEPGDLANVHEELGDAADLAGRSKEAERAYADAQAASTEPRRAALLKIKAATVIEHDGRYVLAARRATAAVKAGDALDAPDRAAVRARGLALLAGLRLRQGRLPDTVSLARAALVDAELANDRPSLGRAWFLLDAALTDLGDPAAAETHDRALPVFEELGDLIGQANTLNNLGINAYYEGHWGEALELYERSRALRLRAGDVLGGAIAANNIGELLSDAGQFDRAEVSFDAALRTFRTRDYAAGIAYALSNLGRLRRRTGRTDEASALLEEADRRFATIGAEGSRTDVRARMCEVLLDQGRPTDAFDQATRAIPLASTSGNQALVALLHRLRGDAHAATHDATNARREYEHSLDVARQAGATVEQADALEALAALDDAPFEDERREAARRLIAALGITPITAPASPPS